MKEIKLTQGKYAIVDDEDYKRLNQNKWFAQNSRNTYYAVRNESRKINNGKQKAIRMQNVIMKPPNGMITDHINHIGFDNRKTNLRICTKQQNHYNQKRRKGSSKHIGVSLQKGRMKKNGKRGKGIWISYVSKNNKRIHIGCFQKETEAAKAYDNKAKELFGKFAVLNFPER